MRSMRLPLLLAAVVIAPALAGCIGQSGISPQGLLPGAGADLGPTTGVVHGLDGLPADAARILALPGAAGGQFHIGTNSFEPTLGVDPLGAIFMTGYYRNPVRGSAPSVLRSEDAGQTWTDVGPKLPTGHGNPPLTNDPYVYVDPVTGRVFMIDLYALICSWLGWSDDGGQTWETNPTACGTPGGNDHQTIVASMPRQSQTNGYPNVVSYCVNRVVDTACAQSLDGGRTFSPLMSVYPGFENGNLCGGLSGHIKASADGKLYLPKAQCGVPEVAVSEDDGASWTRHVISEDVKSQGHEVAVAIDEAGHVYAFWLNEDGMPVFSASKDGEAWSPARIVAPPGVTATEFPAIAAGADGRVVVAYVGTTFEGGYKNDQSPVCSDPLGMDCSENPAWKDATWNGYLGILTDALGENPTITTVTVNDPADPIARGVCGRTRCAGMGDFIDVVVDKDGRPWAAFVDVCTDTCVSDPAAGKDAALGFVGTLLQGPSLRGALAPLAKLAPQAMEGHGHGGNSASELPEVGLVDELLHGHA